MGELESTSNQIQNIISQYDQVSEDEWGSAVAFLRHQQIDQVSVEARSRLLPRTFGAVEPATNRSRDFWT